MRRSFEMLFSLLNQSKKSKRQAFFELQAPSIWLPFERILARPEFRDALFMRSAFESINVFFAHLLPDCLIPSMSAILG
jgi:hypothetical protein